MTSAFIFNTRAELLKTKRTSAMWLTVIGAAFIPFINIIKCVSRPDYFVAQVQRDPWKVWIEYNWQIAASFFLVMYLILLSSLIVQIEYRNNTWKQVYTTPRAYADIFLSKFVIIHFLVIGCFLLFNVFIIASGYITAIVQPRYEFLGQAVPLKEMMLTSLRMYSSVLAVLAIQYWLSLRLGNFVIPLGVGLALFTVGFMIRQWEHIYYYPYMYPFLIYFNNPGLPAETAQRAMINSGLWMAIILLLSFWNVTSRREKG
jgi:lantibiotic transport system permease protein